MHTRKFIAYLDILGFKDLVYNNTHEKLYSLYDKLFTNITTLAIASGKTIITNDGKKETSSYDSSNIRVNSLIISDSIILWTDDNGMKSFIDIVAVLRHLLNYLFKIGIPLRGTLVEGNLDKINKTFTSEKDNSQITLIGLGLVQAYILESEQEWSGCIVDQQCIELYNRYVENFKDEENDLATLDYLVEKELLIKYKPPLKSGQVKELYVINWRPTPDLTEENVRKIFRAHNKNSDDWRVEKIIRNTLDFIEFSQKKSSK